jgi:hypothetical protein
MGLRSCDHGDLNFACIRITSNLVCRQVVHVRFAKATSSTSCVVCLLTAFRANHSGNHGCCRRLRNDCTLGEDRTDSAESSPCPNSVASSADWRYPKCHAALAAGPTITCCTHHCGSATTSLPSARGPLAPSSRSRYELCLLHCAVRSFSFLPSRGPSRSPLPKTSNPFRPRVGAPKRSAQGI